MSERTHQMEQHKIDILTRKRNAVIWMRRMPHYKNFSKRTRELEMDALKRLDEQIKACYSLACGASGG